MGFRSEKGDTKPASWLQNQASKQNYFKTASENSVTKLVISVDGITMSQLALI